MFNIKRFEILIKRYCSKNVKNIQKDFERISHVDLTFLLRRFRAFCYSRFNRTVLNLRDEL